MALRIATELKEPSMDYATSFIAKQPSYRQLTPCLTSFEVPAEPSTLNERWHLERMTVFVIRKEPRLALEIPHLASNTS
jgi:hypothetical protein